MAADGEKWKPRIWTRLLGGFLAIVALVTVTELITLRQQSVIRQSFVLLEQVDNIERFLLECRRQEKNFLLRRDQESQDLFAANFDSLMHRTVELQEVAFSRRIATKIPTLKQTFHDYDEAFENIRSVWLTDIHEEERDRLDRGMMVPARACHAVVAEIREISVSTVSDAYRMTRHVSLISIALGLLLSIVIAGALTRHIAGPLGYLRRFAERVSTGDIQDMDVEFAELEMNRFNTRESFELAQALRRMVTSLRLLVSSERGLMDDYHMTIVVLVNRAVGPGGWSLIEDARSAAGFASFPEVTPDRVEDFLIELGKRAIMLMPKEKVELLCDAIRKLRG